MTKNGHKNALIGRALSSYLPMATIAQAQESCGWIAGGRGDCILMLLFCLRVKDLEDTY